MYVFMWAHLREEGGVQLSLAEVHDLGDRVHSTEQDRTG